MALTLTLGGVSLPLPKADEGWTVEDVPIGYSRRMQSTKLRVDHRGTKARIRVNWDGLTPDEVASLATAFAGAITAPQTLVVPDGRSWSVLVGLNSWALGAPWYDYNGDPWYPLSMTFEEV